MPGAELAITIGLLACVASGMLGVGVAWWLRRRTSLTVRNLYVLAIALLALFIAALAARAWIALLLFGPALAFATAGSLMGRRWRLSDLGAGEELRRYELQRRWIGQPRQERRDGERVYIATQGEIVRERQWPASEPHVPMNAADTARLPRRAGQHVFGVGATGSGKTTSVLRAAAARVLKDDAALLWIDPKGDPPTLEFLQRLAATTGRPFILIDPRADDSDRWQPLWGERPSELVARVLAGIQTSEPYYADTLRQHVTLVANVLHEAGYWPPSFPLLVEASQVRRFDRITTLAHGMQATNPALWRRVRDQAEWVASREGALALSGGLVRLDLVVGDAWRPVLQPRTIADDAHAAVAIAEAINARAIVLWRTHADKMPDEADAITAIALADIHASAIQAGGAPWTLVIDEFGAIVRTCAAQALALLQRGRTHNGQVFVITQSTADIEALTGQSGLLDSLTDNFAGFIVHRQTSPDSRDWLAKLMGTTALWQSTDRTSGHGMTSTGDGSRRRVREFRIGSDTFGDLRRGEAVIYSMHANPTRVMVDPVTLPNNRPVPRIGSDERHACEIGVHASTELPEAHGHSTRTRRAPTRKAAPAKTVGGAQAIARGVPTPQPDPKPTDAPPPANDIDLSDV